jgi:excisionase family DNA binding protein
MDQHNTTVGPLLSSAEETMRELGVCREKLYKLLNSGELESFTIGRSRKIVTASIHAYIGRRLDIEAQKRGVKRDDHAAA